MNAFALARAQTRARRPVQAVLNQHVDEALHRLRRRQASAHSRHLSFGQRLREDDILAAHLQGLWIAGTEAQRVVTERCTRASAAEQFLHMWTRLVAQGLEPNFWGKCWQLCAEDQSLLDAGCEALRWAPLGWNVRGVVEEFLASSHIGVLGWSLLRLCAHQRWPVRGAVLQQALDSAEPEGRAAAHIYCASFGRSDHLAQVLEGIISNRDFDAASLLAAQTALRLGDRHRSTRALWQAGVSGVDENLETEALRRSALVDLCAALPLPQGQDAWREAHAAGAPQARLLAAAEAANDPAHLPWLAQQLGVPAAREDSVAALTGLLGDWEAAINKAGGPLTTDAVMAYVAAQNWPSADARWLQGQALSKDSVFAVLLHGPLRYRHHAARYLALVAPESPDLDVNAPAGAQLNWLFDAESAFEGEAHA